MQLLSLTYSLIHYTRYTRSPQDVALVRAEIVDAQGQVVPSAAHNVTFSVASGPGRIIAVGNGDPRCHEPNHASWRSAYHGLVRVVVQASVRAAGSVTERRLLQRIDRDAGMRTSVNLETQPQATAIQITATAPGLHGASLAIPTSVNAQDAVLPSAARSVGAANLG